MNYMHPDIRLNTNCNNCFGRCMSWESCVFLDYDNTGADGAFLGLTPHFPAKIVPIKISSSGGFQSKKGAYFASKGAVKVGYNLDCCTATCCCAGATCPPRLP
jgi:uncharacterized protein (AIM24 family)